jgi:hypothetical protein
MTTLSPTDPASLEAELMTAIEAAGDEATLEQLRVAALGKKVRSASF